MSQSEEWITIYEAARRYPVAENTLYLRVKRGWMEFKTVRRPSPLGVVREVWVVRARDVEQYLRDRAEGRITSRPKTPPQPFVLGISKEERRIPPHLLPAFHLYVRAVAAGVDLGIGAGSNAGGTLIARAAERITLVETEAEAEARMIAQQSAAGTVEYDAARGIWAQRRAV